MNEIKINWKVRLKNSVWLKSFLAFIVATIFNLLGYFDIPLTVTQAQVLEIIESVLYILSVFGVIVDPTTKGMGDSERALNYNEPA